MKRLGALGVVTLAVMVILLSPGARAQDTGIYLNTGLQSAPPAPVGSGARAMGTGGAFIAVADDATSANWNPGGMVQLVKPEVSFVLTGEQKNVDDSLSYSNQVNHISLVYPFNAGGYNMVTSVNYQNLYDFYFRNSNTLYRHNTYDVVAAKLNYGPFDPTDPLDPPVDPVVLIGSYERVGQRHYETEKMGALEAISTSFAIQVTPEFSAGFSYNFWSDRWMSPGYEFKGVEINGAGTVTLQNTSYFVPGGFGKCTCNGGKECIDTHLSPASDVQYVDNPECLGDLVVIDATPPDAPIAVGNNSIKTRETSEMEGQNFVVGILWKIDPQWTLGAVYRSELEVEQKRTFRQKYYNFAPARASIKYNYDETLRLPASYGIGLAYRYNDNLSFAFDATRIEWNRYMYERADGSEISPVNGMPIKDADIDATMTYRLGGEYLILQPQFVVPLRMGFFYDPDPARGSPDDYYGVSAGTGVATERFAVDVAYWYRWGNDVVLYTDYQEFSREFQEFRGDVSRQQLMLSGIVYF